MTWGRCFVAVLFIFLATSGSSAQFIYPVSPNGVTVRYQGRHWAFNAYFAPTPVWVLPSPFVPQTTVIVHRVILPPPVVYYVPSPEYDLTGVDLDLVPSKIPPPKPIEVPPNPKRAGEPPPVRPKPPARPDLPPAKDNPAEEHARLLEVGITAFQAEEYGLALRRFKQAVDLEPALSRGHFLLSQALFALGKYQLATSSIESGMRLQPTWPSADFRPRFELYKGHEDVWESHLARLAGAAKGSPDNAALLFLHGHQLWFDGQRAEAVILFQKARKTSADPAFIDAFLKTAAGAVAAK